MGDFSFRPQETHWDEDFTPQPPPLDLRPHPAPRFADRYRVRHGSGTHPEFGEVTYFLGGSVLDRFGYLYNEDRYFLASSSSGGLKRIKAGGVVNLSSRSTKGGRDVQSAADNGGLNCSRRLLGWQSCSSKYVAAENTIAGASRK